MTDFRTKDIQLELEKGQRLTVTHQGSVWSFLIEADNYDDLNVKRISRYSAVTPTHQKPIREGGK